ncbi:MAG: hypothetical protein ACTHM7_07945, partial [Ginsengibacter sp.]
YTVAVRHRNHLGNSTDPAAFTPMLTEKQSTTSFVDFTASSFLFGGNSAHGVAPDGKFVLWGGDANLNGVVKFNGPSNDRDYILNTILLGIPSSQLTAYSGGDLNMDGIVKFNGPSNDRDFLLSQILSSNTAVILTQQLP